MDRWFKSAGKKGKVSPETAKLWGTTEGRHLITNVLDLDMSIKVSSCTSFSWNMGAWTMWTSVSKGFKRRTLN